MADRKQGEASRRLRFELSTSETEVRTRIKVLEAVTVAHGNLVQVAQLLGVGRRTIDRIMGDYPELAAAVREAREAHGRAVRSAQQEAERAAGEGS